MRGIFLLVGAIALGLVLAAVGAAASTAPEPARAMAGEPLVKTRVLSNELTRSRWAFVEHRVKARVRPEPGARAVKTLKLTTEDGTQELVLALRQKKFDDGTTWVLVRLPMRPNGTTGWVEREALGDYRVVRTRLVINRKRFTFRFYKRGKLALGGRVGVGKPGTATPDGRFYVRERLVPTNSDSVYGVFAFGTSAFSPNLTDWPGGGIIGVHGTNQPRLIPGRISHGCVRIRNEQILKLKRMMPLGTPIRIR